eukprot:scaffold18122_cov194-Amphora_coffeaeformis.AAC.8
MKKNKYHIRAVRHELEDDYLRHGQWNKFRGRVEQLAADDPQLLQAVVMPSSSHGSSKLYKGGGGRGRAGDTSLLHIVLQLYSRSVRNSAGNHHHHKGDKKEEVVCHIVRILAHAVPQALITTTKDYGETPLHVAMDRSCPLAMVQILCEAIQCKLLATRTMEPSADPLRIKDRHGNTPLLLAAQANKGYTHLLLPLCTTTDTTLSPPTLVTCQRKGKIPLWYAAYNETRTAVKHDDYTISDELQALLLATARHIMHYYRNANNSSAQEQEEERQQQQQQQQSSFPMSSDGKLDNHKDDDAFPSTKRSSSFEVWRELVTCAPFLDKYAVKLMDLCLASRHVYAGMLVTEPPSGVGGDASDSLLHILCRQQEMTSTSTPNLSTTNALLFEQVWNFLQQDEEENALLPRILQMPDGQGNLPLHLAVQKDYLTTLLQAYPTALRHANVRGELPLHVALKRQHANTSTAAATIPVLWQADPSTLAVRDGVTGLYPYLLAATSHGVDGNMDDVTLSYQILSAAPEVLGRS